MALHIRIARADFDTLMGHLHTDGNEQHAFLLCGKTSTPHFDLLTVRRMICADPHRDLAANSPAYVSLKPAYAFAALERAQSEGLHLVDVHSHPFCGDGVRFSATDRNSAIRRFEWHRERLPDMISVGLVFGRSSVHGSYQCPATGGIRPVTQLQIAGASLEIWPAGGKSGFTGAQDMARFDRQVQAFGPEAQSMLGQLQVGVVGCGGTGSATVQQLAHLGVRRFVLCDPDVVEVSNLNRLIGSTHEHVGHSKVDVAETNIRRVVGDAEVVALQQSVDEPRVFPFLAGCDVVFGCGDNAGVRAVLTDLATRCLMPYIDLGVGIDAEGGRIKSAGGQVSFYTPGSVCLGCHGRLDPVRVSEALRTPEERAVHEMAYGVPTPQPSVVSLNGVVASLAVGEFLKWVTGWAAPSARLQFEAQSGEVHRILGAPDPMCLYCSSIGVRGLGWDPEVPRDLVSTVPEAVDAT